MARGGPNYVRCYDKYIPEITGFAEKGQTDSQECITTAENSKADELEKVEEQRSELETHVSGLSDSLTKCTNSKDDTIEYAKCLNEDVSRI